MAGEPQKHVDKQHLLACCFNSWGFGPSCYILAKSCVGRLVLLSMLTKS